MPYELKLLIHCIENKYFSIALLNERINCFDFVYDKPSPTDVNVCRSVTKLRQSASQMMTLSRYFPLLIGDKVPESDENWVSFLLLLKICSISLSPTCTLETIPYLRTLIEEKMISFKHLYPASTLIPKFHYLIHYPSQIEQFGPLIHSWTMRQESKLSFFKRVSKRGNFKNIPQTVAKKTSAMAMLQNSCRKNVSSYSNEYSPKSTSCLLESEEQHVITEIIRVFPSSDCTSMISHPNWVKCQSTVCRKGVFLLLKYDSLSPEFCKINDIFVLNETVFMDLTLWGP